MSTRQFLFSGFGGQGILFAGKFMAQKAMYEGKELSWLPSYGPEMRGGTASCSVIIGDEPVGSPIVTHPDVLVAMNLPSYDRYEQAVVPGGIVVIDSSLIERAPQRSDVKTIAIPATKLANENGIPTLANMIIVGRILKELNDYSQESLDTVLHKIVSARHADLLAANFNALKIGAEYTEE